VQVGERPPPGLYALAVPDATHHAHRVERVFPALLKYWRAQRGMSRLDLAIAAEVSARHLSFLETGRSRPSVEMVLTLAGALDIPLRNRNELLRATGFGARYPEPGIDALLTGTLGDTVDTMLAHHDPYPMVVVDRTYAVVRRNNAARTLLGLAGIDDGADLNLARLIFDPAVRPLIANWHELTGDVLRRVQREVLHHPLDDELAELLADLVGTHDVDDRWRQGDAAAPDEPAVSLDLSIGEVTMSFLTTMTVFNAAGNVTLDELRIESWYPRDDATRQWCRELLGGR